VDYPHKSFLEYLPILCCPHCKAPLKLDEGTLECQNSHCNRSYPIVDGKPILINEENSLFSIADYLTVPDKVSIDRESNITSRLKKFKRLYFSLSADLGARDRLRKVREVVHESSSSPTVVVIGAGTEGAGMQEVYDDSSLMLINTDVSITASASIICDAHDLPFTEGSIDGVIVQAVLEHVIDPQRCVVEMYRVLKDTGIVYSEIPFMQQVHLGRLDFTRFTHLGHRRLFRHFEEIDSGLVAGPGTSLAWCCTYLLRSFVKSRAAHKIVASYIAPMVFSWLRYFD